MDLVKLVELEDKIIEPQPVLEEGEKKKLESIREYVKETKTNYKLQVYIDETSGRMYIEFLSAVKLGLVSLEQQKNFSGGLYPVYIEIINKLKAMGYEIKYVRFNAKEISLYLNPDDNLNNFENKKETNCINESEIHSIEDNMENHKFRR